MKKYLVVALSVGALSNKIFSAGEEVSEDAFEAGRADELVQKGFLKELTSVSKNDLGDDEPENFEDAPDGDLKPDEPENFNTGKQEDISLQEPENLNTQAPQDIDSQIPQNTINEDTNDKEAEGFSNEPIIDTLSERAPVPSIDDITKNQLITDLKAFNVEFDMKATKKELYDLWLNR